MLRPGDLSAKPIEPDYSSTATHSQSTDHAGTTTEDSDHQSLQQDERLGSIMVRYLSVPLFVGGNR